jgi:hypothetical protein
VGGHLHTIAQIKMVWIHRTNNIRMQKLKKKSVTL